MFRHGKIHESENVGTLTLTFPVLSECILINYVFMYLFLCTFCIKVHKKTRDGKVKMEIILKMSIKKCYFYFIDLQQMIETHLLNKPFDAQNNDNNNINLPP